MTWTRIQRKSYNKSIPTYFYELTWSLSREGGHGGMLGGMLGGLLGGGDGHAEQMAVMIVFVAPLK